MAITRYNPNTIFLGGEQTEVGDLAVSEAVTPGMLVETFNSGGVIRWRKATADLDIPPAVALNQSMLNKGVDDAYAANDLAQVGIGHKGSTWWMLIGSGANISAGNLLGSAGAGLLKASATKAIFRALENKPSVTTLTRIRVEVI